MSTNPMDLPRAELLRIMRSSMAPSDRVRDALAAGAGDRACVRADRARGVPSDCPGAAHAGMAKARGTWRHTGPRRLYGGTRS